MQLKSNTINKHQFKLFNWIRSHKYFSESDVPKTSGAQFLKDRIFGVFVFNKITRKSKDMNSVIQEYDAPRIT